MSSVKGEMISSRPADSRSAGLMGSGGGMGGGSSFAQGPTNSIGNYKGVMLCNRPFQGISAAAKTAKTSSGKPPFKSAVVPYVQLGLQNARDSSTLVQRLTTKRTKTSTALSKHKAWLATLQKGIKKAQDDYRKEQEAKQKKLKKLSDQQARFRRKVCRTGEYAESKVKTNDPNEHMQSEHVDNEYKEADYEPVYEKPKLSNLQKKKIASKQKPAWALTEVTREEKEEKEADDLLDFAKDLDFDKYADDFEVRMALEAVRKVVANKEEEEKKQKKKEAFEQAVAASEAQREAHKDDINFFAGEGKEEEFEGKYAEDDEYEDESKTNDITEIATNLLGKKKDVAHVHSIKSFTQVAERVQGTLSSSSPNNTMTSSVDNIPSPIAKPRPRIVTHKDERKLGSEDPSNLPYLHRNPAV